MAGKRNTLCLVDKMKLLDYAKHNSTVGMRKIASNVAELKPQGINADFQTNVPASRQRSRNAQYDDPVYEWYHLAN